MSEYEYEIRTVYLKAPSWEEISSFIEELNVSYAQFERYFSMHEGIIRHIKNGNKKLPAKHWPIIYERIIPKYIMDYKECIIKKPYISKVPKPVPMPLDTDTHNRLDKTK